MKIVFWDSRQCDIHLQTRDGMLPRTKEFKAVFSFKNGKLGQLIRDETPVEEYDLIFAAEEAFKTAIQREGAVVIPTVRKRILDGKTVDIGIGPFQTATTARFGTLQRTDRWLEGALKLAEKTFRPILEENERPNPKLMFWLEGGWAAQRGFRRPSPFPLERAILRRYDYWKSPGFRKYQSSKKFTLWGARLQSLQDAGFKEKLTEARLKKGYYFLFPAKS